jgi:hypothetical protein
VSTDFGLIESGEETKCTENCVTRMHEIWMFENVMLRRIFGPKRDEEPGVWI